MSKPKHSKSHKQQLCAGEMVWTTDIPTQFGHTYGFRCSLCGKTLRGGAGHALHHVAAKEIAQ